MELILKKTLIFQNKHVPVGTSLIGFSALAEFFKVKAPVRSPSCISEAHVKNGHRQEGDWCIYDKRYAPNGTVEEHLIFAIKHENLDLLLLKRIFAYLPEKTLCDFILSKPIGIAVRKIWFLYEYLTGKTLPVPDAPSVAMADILSAQEYFIGAGVVSRRHKVRNNFLGTNRFCPIIRKTAALQAMVRCALSEKAKEMVGRVSAQLIGRAASFLLLADSRASFQIEGEQPPRNRLERWGRAILQAGKYPVSLDEIVRLHNILIEDNRFIQPGLRSEGVFIGERDYDGQPLPEFIGARPEDLQELMDALVETNRLMSEFNLDPVLQAAATAFGFVYIHPFQDGNGRLHRCLIHHVLAERSFTPQGLVFPVSAVLLSWINEYRTILQSHSRPLMDFIEWHPTANANVRVDNDTADLYRFFDGTEAAEFLYRCVQRTIEKDLPWEFDYLLRHDEAMRRLMDRIDMPDRLAEDFLMFMRQNGWSLPRKRRQQEFAQLSDEEVTELEIIVQDAFAGFEV